MENECFRLSKTYLSVLKFIIEDYRSEHEALLYTEASSAPGVDTLSFLQPTARVIGGVYGIFLAVSIV